MEERIAEAADTVLAEQKSRDDEEKERKPDVKDEMPIVEKPFYADDTTN